MEGVFDPRSANFLGGNNVHHLAMIGLLVYIAIRVSK
jgi:hypothetical protein